MLAHSSVQFDKKKSSHGHSEINFKNIIENMVPTAKGHLDQEQANLQSTESNLDDSFQVMNPTKHTNMPLQ